MEEYSLGAVEGRFADLIWEKEPIVMSELIPLCEEIFGWKRTTTYTVVKRLSGKGIFQNKDGIVSAVLSKEEFYARQSEEYVESSFGGSLPGFLAAFTRRRKLSEEDIANLQEIIAKCEPEDTKE
ncbi:BlaI/MecI/CopY family transcriptional regulator [Anaerosporobacter faecicola]|uniref:BlaI/MecI/CopY family transcriptional regulator n=1 Tax=Anaerosporobacter faecicola TaxID=2718714 RepID=UPI00143C1EDC|nr:BlaI/MecI/CopY family transcriptional regulator [Anaerosporobacter faecicola]